MVCYLFVVDLGSLLKTNAVGRVAHPEAPEQLKAGVVSHLPEICDVSELT